MKIPDNGLIMELEPVSEKIKYIIKSSNFFNRSELAKLLNIVEDVDFRLSLNDALLSLSKEGKDFKPLGYGGNYILANPIDTLKRASKYRRAGIKKIARSSDKLHGLLNVSESDQLKQVVKRAAEKTDYIKATIDILMRRKIKK